MTELLAWGYPEQELRRHSPEWVRNLQKALQARRRVQLADLARITSLAVAAAFDQNAHDQLTEATSEMAANAGYGYAGLEGDAAASASMSSDDWLLNPDAKTDMDAFHAAIGVAQSSPNPDERLQSMAIHMVKTKEAQA